MTEAPRHARAVQAITTTRAVHHLLIASDSAERVEARDEVVVGASQITVAITRTGIVIDTATSKAKNDVRVAHNRAAGTATGETAKRFNVAASIDIVTLDHPLLKEGGHARRLMTPIRVSAAGN